MDPPTIAAMKTGWDLRRPFVVASRLGCPAPPPEASLATVPAEDSYGGMTLKLRPAALAAYNRMLAAARAESPQIASDRRLLTLFSAWRRPDAETARCVAEANCQGVARATCSAHLTGLAVDLDLGAAPGDRLDSSDDANRLYISQGAAYRWLVANAARFGFVPYAFEPWHWEWTGEPI
jgi:LAS superfamily LD-carboxypeptidase LdcB